MTNTRVIYTDGRSVMITDTNFSVKKHSYKIQGIIKHYFHTISANRWPALALTLLGAGIAVAGYLFLVPPEVMLRWDRYVVDGNPLAFYGGIALAFLGLLLLIFARKRYAVRIATAEGEKNALVSSKKEYVLQIVDALHSAIDFQYTSQPVIPKKTEPKKTV